MKRILALLGVVAALALGGVAPAQADTSDFRFASFDGQYSLTRDADGYSHLATVETLVAEFPDFDQNHGIVRTLVDNYDGHPVHTDVESVTDGDGNAIDYDEESDNGNLVLQIGDADEYVHGEQTYVITYTQRDVTKYFANTNDDEFYWDTNGTEWGQPFGSVTATVRIADDLLESLTGDVSAPYGSEGENRQAEIGETDNAYTFSAGDFSPGDNLTVIVGFAPHTFAQRPTGFFDSPLPSLGLVGLLIGLVVFVLAFVLRRTGLADAAGRGFVVAEYVAPKGVSLPMSAVVLGRKARVTPAMIVGLAVAGNIRIVEETGRRKPSYRLDFITADGADADQLEFLHALFGPTFEPGETHSLLKNDASGAKDIANLMTRVTAEATVQGYRKPRPTARIVLVTLLAAGAGAFAGFFSLAALSENFGGAVPMLFVAAAVIVFLATVALLIRHPLSAKGVELRDYLKGLKVYIDLAEEDRLRYLQSPQGAERTPIATDDKATIVKLNEKLLPYAVLFGIEREWAQQLGKYYEETNQQPNWYYGSTAFNAAYFASSIGSLNASVATSFTSTSSSSGGTSGGGFSGGGGGGGGGGGW